MLIRPNRPLVWRRDDGTLTTLRPWNVHEVTESLGAELVANGKAEEVVDEPAAPAAPVEPVKTKPAPTEAAESTDSTGPTVQTKRARTRGSRDN